MKMYEYKIERVGNDIKDMFKDGQDKFEKEVLKKLDSLGREGWELCAADGNCFYLKKEI